MTDQRKRKGAPAPVSAHPAFPAFVAAWFAALLGLGSLVLPVALFEHASEASGLARVIAAAQPPLGPTAQIVIALAAAVLGAVGGLALARRVIAETNAEAASPARVTAAPAKRPISAHDELFAGGFDADETPRDAQPARACAETPAAPPLELAPFALAGEAADEPPAAAGGPRTAAEKHPAPGAMTPDAVTPDVMAPDTGPAQDRTLAELTIVELVDRFAKALDRHRHATLPPSSANPVGEIAAGSVRTNAADAAHPAGAVAATGGEPIARFPDRRSEPARPARPSVAAGAETALRDALEKLQKLSGAA